MTDHDRLDAEQRQVEAEHLASKLNPDTGNDQTPAPDPKRRRWPWVAGIVAALLLGIGIGAAGGDVEPAAAEVVTETVEVEVEPADLAEQREKWAQRTGELGAREAKLDEREAELDELTESLKAREKVILAEEERVAANTITGDGTWLVGDDIEPGTYSAQGSGDRCYWQRLSGLSGESSDRITNYLGSARTTVTIAASDVAFETSRCGEWVKQ